MKLKESDILRHLVQSVVSAPSKFILEGVKEQDDCAVLAPQSDTEICLTTDFVRGTGFHLFRTGHLSFRDVGRYVVAANVSDLSAMGATPVGYLSIVRYANGRTADEVMEILDGISEACREFDCTLIGGDSGSYEADVLAGTAIGYVKKGARLSRRALNSGHAIYVSGDVGRPATALAMVINQASLAQNVSERQEKILDRLLERWRRPVPRISLGQALSQSGLVSSCMDVSDGLTASLLQLKQINGFGCDLIGENIPIDWSVKEAATLLEKEVFDLACGASVDFELLFTAPENVESKLSSIASEVGVSISRIGTVRSDDKLRFFPIGTSTVDHLPGIPWDHQYSNITEMFRK